MPLFNGEFDDNACEQFIAAKENLWVEFGYGPWAFVVEGEFAGWGGLQPENGDADLALVLHPRYWGVGKVIYKRIIDIAKKNSLPISQKAIFIYNQLIISYRNGRGSLPYPMPPRSLSQTSLWHRHFRKPLQVLSVLSLIRRPDPLE